MSWKLAELKWREELGLYQSRWERDSGPLPLERKQAINAFERRKRASPCRRGSTLARHWWKTSPERHDTRLGTTVPPASPSPFVTLPIAHSSPTFLRSYPRDLTSFSSRLRSRTVIEAAPTQDKALAREARIPTRRSQSCSALSEPYPPLSQEHRPTHCNPSSQAKRSQDSSSWLLAPSTHIPHTPGPCEELTRLLDHIDSASSSDSEPDENSPVSALDTLLHFAHSRGQETRWPPVLQPFRSSEIACSKDRLDFGGANFRLLGNPQSKTIDDIVTAADSSETHWSTTVSKHDSFSTLLPKANMSEQTSRHTGNSPSTTDDESASVPQSITQSQRLPVRRTTPIYQRFDQAYASITGGMPGSRLMSPTPGTDSLNNVYTRAMHEEPVPSRDTSFIPSAGTAGVFNGIELPFRGTMSPENDEHMNIEDEDDNPARLQINADDVALQPILRSGPRNSVTLLSSSTHEPSTVVFVEGNNGVRDRSTSLPMRPRTPYPGLGSANSGLDSTMAAIVDEYVDSDEDTNLTVPAKRGLQDSSSSSEEQNTIAGPSVGRVFAQPRQRRELPASGPPPSWPLPVEPSTQPEGRGALAQLSSSPPTYGTTTGLLNQDRHPTSALHQGSLQHPVPARLRTSSLYSSEMDEVIARRGRSNTPFDQIGDPGPAVPSSPRSSSPSAGAVGGAAPNFNQTHGSGSDNKPLSSSGIGIALTSVDDPVVRYLHDTDIRRIIEPVSADDDAWETTQGSNTQRNSAVPDVDVGATSSSSSLGRLATSTWDPLAARREELEDVEREFAGLVQSQRINLLGGNQTSTPEGSAGIASPQATVHPRPSTSLASPDSEQTITQTPISQIHNKTSSEQSTTGNSLLLRTPRANMPIPKTVTEMNSDTASEQDDAAAERAARLAAIEEEIRRYEPRPDNAPPRRYWSEARLTIDRRILDAENDPDFVRRQHRLSRLLLCLFIPFYPYGGFLFVDSMATNGPMARYTLLVASLFGGVPINNVHHEDMALAEQIEYLLEGVVGVVVAALSGVLIAFLCGALE